MYVESVSSKDIKCNLVRMPISKIHRGIYFAPCIIHSVGQLSLAAAEYNQIHLYINTAIINLSTIPLCLRSVHLYPRTFHTVYIHLAGFCVVFSINKDVSSLLQWTLTTYFMKFSSGEF